MHCDSSDITLYHIIIFLLSIFSFLSISLHIFLYNCNFTQTSFLMGVVFLPSVVFFLICAE